MAKSDDADSPVHYKGVMVSSTFTDLKEHRAALINAIKAQQFMPVAMEHDSARPAGDVIDSSLKMVQDASAYVGVISHKYGQIPEDHDRNTDRLSLTELEFNKARELGRPVLLFIMGDQHSVKPADIETDPQKRQKLNAFRENAKPLKTESSVHRVYNVFNDIHEFEVAATKSLAKLREYFQEQNQPPKRARSRRDRSRSRRKSGSIPKPPAFYAEPPYIGSHKFIGRKEQLDTMSQWAAPADSHPILLFEAIGGTGKSMLTWEWTTKHSTTVRDDWSGRFWYSFYEKGAIMADFCRRALAYMTQRPLEDFHRMKTVELGGMLLHQLQARPWLLILDGLERVLVSYHRFDAAQVADEDAGTTDRIANRDPCAAIRPEDDDLLRALAAAAPSKLLLTSRLMPRVLLNQASQPIPGVLRVPLPGLRPSDAEQLFRSCGITGTSQDIQNFLTSHCDCHPLVTGVLAGLINDYLPDRGNFDAWVADPAAGGIFNLSQLDLTQKRNHILRAALAAIPEKSRQLLSTLALLSGAVDFQTLSAFNPHLPPEPERVDEPENTEDRWLWKQMSDDQKKEARQRYQDELLRRRGYEDAITARLRSPEFLAAPRALTNTVRDLEKRGLLQYDAQARRYDLHPVVRAVAAGRLQDEERDRYGQRVVDHFSQQPHRPYDEAETIADVQDGLHIVRTLLRMERLQQAVNAYRGDLAEALYYNLEVHAEGLALLRPFFVEAWSVPDRRLSIGDHAYLSTFVAYALEGTGKTKEALEMHGRALIIDLAEKDWDSCRVDLHNIAVVLGRQNRQADEERHLLRALDLAEIIDDQPGLFATRVDRFGQLAVFGRWSDAEAMWQLLDRMGRDWPRWRYRPGQAEAMYAYFRFFKGDLTEDLLSNAEQLAKKGKSRSAIRSLYGLRGEWLLEQGQWELAATSLQEAIRMAHEIGMVNARAHAQLALAKFHLRQLPNARQVAEQLAAERLPAERPLANLWLALGEPEEAKKHARIAYETAWADGEPYVHRHGLDKARALLEQLGAEIPDLPPYGPTKDEKLPWEDDVAAALETLRAEKAAYEEEP